MSMMVQPGRFAAPAAALDPYFASVVLLAHMDGPDGSTTITDSSPSAKTLTASGGCQLDTAQSKFGGASSLHLGGGERITTPDSADWHFGTGQFTVECFARMNSKTDLQTFVTQWTGGWAFYIDGGQLKLRVIISAGIVDLAYTWTPTLGQWYHLACDRDWSGKTRLYIDGVMVASSTAQSGSFDNSTNSLVLGAIGTGSSFPTYYYNGWLDDFRITKGVARYATDGSFTVPTTAFPDAAGDYTIPLPFEAGMWTAIASGNSGKCFIRINYLPLNGGSAITKLQYQIAGGGWNDLVGTGVGVREVAGFTNGVAMNLEIRAVNSVGNGNASDIKTPTANNSGQDPHYADVKLLLHMDGVDTSTTFTDNSGTPKTMAAAGNAQIDTAISKFGGASGLFDGNGDRVTTADSLDWHFPSGTAFTIEFFAYLTTNTSSQGFLGHWGIGGNAWQFLITSGGVLRFTMTIGSAQNINYTWTPSLSQWYHIAVDRDMHGTVRLYVDGVVVATSTAMSGTPTNSTTSLAIGTDNILGGANDFEGNLDEVRITKGTARYAGTDFTVPTAAYPNS